MRSSALPGDSPPASTGASVVGVVGALRSFDRRTAERMTMLRKPSTRRPALMPHIRRGPIGLGQRAGRQRPDQRERLHQAAEHGEDLAATLVRDDLLDQRHVADEADAVSDPEDDGADAADREIGADGADRDAERR